ncbi:MAG: hypothetical protein Hals2KO_21770 [Halioglobus sp.]
MSESELAERAERMTHCIHGPWVLHDGVFTVCKKCGKFASELAGELTNRNMRLEAERDALIRQRRILWDAAWAAIRSLPEAQAQALHFAMQQASEAGPPTIKPVAGSTLPGSREP